MLPARMRINAVRAAGVCALIAGCAEGFAQQRLTGVSVSCLQPVASAGKRAPERDLRMTISEDPKVMAKVDAMMLSQDTNLISSHTSAQLSTAGVHDIDEAGLLDDGGHAQGHRMTCKPCATQAQITGQDTARAMAWIHASAASVDSPAHLEDAAAVMARVNEMLGAPHTGLGSSQLKTELDPQSGRTAMAAPSPRIEEKTIRMSTAWERLPPKIDEAVHEERRHSRQRIVNAFSSAQTAVHRVLPTALLSPKGYLAGSRGRRRKEMRLAYLQMTAEQRAQYHDMNTSIRHAEREKKACEEGIEAASIQRDADSMWTRHDVKKSVTPEQVCLASDSRVEEPEHHTSFAKEDPHHRAPLLLPPEWSAQVNEDSSTYYHTAHGAQTVDDRPMFARAQDYLEAGDSEVREALARITGGCLDYADGLTQSEMPQGSQTSRLGDHAPAFIAAPVRCEQALLALEGNLQQASLDMAAVLPRPSDLSTPSASCLQATGCLEDVCVQFLEKRDLYEEALVGIQQDLEDQQESDRVAQVRVKYEAEWEQRVADSSLSQRQRADYIRQNWLSIWAKAATKKPLTLGL